MPSDASINLSLSDRSALEVFATQNPELEKLERLLGQFNIFEAIGAARRELRHSDFLAYLFNPKQNHGLGASFLKRFLQEVGLASDGDLSGVDVRREWGHIDILVVDDNARRVILIENKIDTGEHSNQLACYHNTVQRVWPDYDILPFYLTPDGTEPTDKRYQAIGYELVCRVVTEVAEKCQHTPDQAVYILMTHYVQMLGKHIVSESEISELCRRIYQEHRQALDLIYKHKPDRRRQITDTITHLVQEDPDWTRWDGGINWMTCRPVAWEGSRYLNHISFGLFQYWKQPLLDFAIRISGKESTHDDRHNLWEMAQRLDWRPDKIKVNKDTEIYRYPLLHASDAEVEGEELEALIQERWAAFLNEQYPKLQAQLHGEQWLWEEGYVPPARPFRQSDAGVIAEHLVKARPDLLTLNSGKHFYSFCPKQWTQSPVLYQESLPEIKLLLYVTVEIEPQYLNFIVQIRKGPEHEHVRQKLYQMAEREHWPGMEPLRRRWTTVYKLPVLVAADYQLNHTKLQSRIEYRWAEFMEHHLPAIMETVRQEKWLWN